MGDQAPRRDLLFRRISRRRLLDHGRDHGVVAGVPVGRDLPVLAVPGLNATAARAFVVFARHLDRPQFTFEAQLLEPISGEIEVLDTPAHLLTGQGLLAETLLGGADRLDSEHGVDQAAHIEDFAGFLPFGRALALVEVVFLAIVMHLAAARRALSRVRVATLAPGLALP